MTQEIEYFKLIRDLTDAQQQQCYLIQRLLSVDDEIKALSKQFKEQNDIIQSKPDEERTKEDYNKFFELNNKHKVLCEILDMHKTLHAKKQRRSLELQKRLEQYCKRHGIDLPDSLNKKITLW